MQIGASVRSTESVSSHAILGLPAEGQVAAGEQSGDAGPVTVRLLTSSPIGSFDSGMSMLLTESSSDDGSPLLDTSCT